MSVVHGLRAGMCASPDIYILFHSVFWRESVSSHVRCFALVGVLQLAKMGSTPGVISWHWPLLVLECHAALLMLLLGLLSHVLQVQHGARLCGAMQRGGLQPAFRGWRGTCSSLCRHAAVPGVWLRLQLTAP